MRGVWLEEKNPPPMDAPALSKALLKTVRAGDAEAVRALLDGAFWAGADFRPAWHHLFFAVEAGRADIARILAAHGADWTEDAARFIGRELVASPRAEILSTLRAAGLRRQAAVIVAGKRPEDALSGLHMLRRAGEDDSDMRKKFLDAVRDRVVELAWSRFTDPAAQALETLALREDLSGPVNLTPEFSRLKHNMNDFLWLARTVREAGHEVAPVSLRELSYYDTPCFAALKEKGLMPAGTIRDRVSMARNMRILLEIGHERGYDRDLRSAAVLFGRDIPLSGAEVAEFVDHFSRMRAYGICTPQVSGRLCADLAPTGFFDGPAWTEEMLRAVAAWHDGLSPLFNEKAKAAGAAERFFRKPDADGLDVFLDAFWKTGYHASLEQVESGLRFLHRAMEKGGDLRGRAHMFLIALRCGGTDFTCVDPCAFLGKKVPGLAEALLRTDAVTAEAFAISKIRERREKVLGTGYEGAYTGFLCHVALKQAFPGKYGGGTGTYFYRCYQEEKKFAAQEGRAFPDVLAPLPPHSTYSPGPG